MWIGGLVIAGVSIESGLQGVKWAENGGHEHVTDGYLYVGLVVTTVVVHAVRVVALLK